jgi:hypothetical protein
MVANIPFAGSNLDKAREVFTAAVTHRPRIRLTIRQRLAGRRAVHKGCVRVNHPMQALSGCRELLCGLDADDGRDAGGFKLAPGVAEKLLHGSDVETAADLVRPGDGEALAGGRE